MRSRDCTPRHQQSHPNIVQISIIGSSGVGKSAIRCRFAASYFIDGGVDPTDEDYRRQLDIPNGPPCLMELNDLESEDYPEVQERILSDSDAVMVVTPKPIILIGNKADSPRSNRVVSFAEGASLATALKCGFAEVSAKDGMNVDAVFCEIVGRVRVEEGRRREGWFERFVRFFRGRGPEKAGLLRLPYSSSEETLTANDSASKGSFAKE